MHTFLITSFIGTYRLPTSAKPQVILHKPYTSLLKCNINPVASMSHKHVSQDFSEALPFVWVLWILAVHSGSYSKCLEDPLSQGHQRLISNLLDTLPKLSLDFLEEGDRGTKRNETQVLRASKRLQQQWFLFSWLFVFYSFVCKVTRWRWKERGKGKVLPRREPGDGVSCEKERHSTTVMF